MTLKEAKQKLSQKFQSFQDESKVTDDNSILFFSTFKNENFLINNENFGDLCKLSNFFKVKRLIIILDEFKDNHNFDPDFIINEILKQIQNETNILYHDDKFSFDMETNLYERVNECLQNERFGLLPIPVIYRILSKSTEEISGNFLFDFISKSIESRFTLLSFLNYETLSDEKFGELIDLCGQTQHYFQYLPPNLMFLKSVKDENKIVKARLDELEKKCNKLEEYLNDAFKFAEYVFVFNRDQEFGAEAVSLLEKWSENGNPLASLFIAFLNFEHSGEEGSKIAFSHLQKSFDEGNIYAPCIIGHFYQEGIGVEKDIIKAAEYYKQSAEEKGDTNGICKLASLYMDVNGVEKDISKVIELYKQAQALGSSSCLLKLGKLYMEGKDVEKDVSKAINYFKKSADLRNIEALTQLGKIYQDGEVVEKNLTLALDYYEKAAKSIFCSSDVHSSIKQIKSLKLRIIKKKSTRNKSDDF